jgi:hypothetical protein
MNTSLGSYVTSSFFKDKMKDLSERIKDHSTAQDPTKKDPTHKLSCNLQCIDVSWIFHDYLGHKFLENIYVSENAEIYTNNTIKFVVHYIYRIYKIRI